MYSNILAEYYFVFACKVTLKSQNMQLQSRGGGL